MATESDNVNSGALGTLLAVGLFSVIGIAFVVTALVRTEMADEAEKKDVSADRPYRDLVAEQGAKMNAPASYVDRGRGLVSLPIERAMELTVEGLKKDPNSATPPPPAAAGTGGSGGAAAETGGTGGGGGTGGSAEGEAKPADEAIHAEAGQDKNKPEGDKPAGDKPAGDKPAGDKPAGDKPEPKKEPKKAPVPVPPNPAPGPATPVSPAPNGQ